MSASVLFGILAARNRYTHNRVRYQRSPWLGCLPGDVAKRRPSLLAATDYVDQFGQPNAGGKPTTCVGALRSEGPIVRTMLPDTMPALVAPFAHDASWHPCIAVDRLRRNRKGVQSYMRLRL